ncbi:MAG: winged helix-turn-helix transcriptional regulator [Rhodospirillales bacterium]|nr:winged helix-turn-helix transcriptional regulator [Rhodospirillales bacterium]MBO6787747.1 winged helix-turn-helix transcriptional regulator [Rhodospirillales bacterium]
MDNEAKITLGLLNMVHDNAQASQRSMADGLGIALGLANAYLKRCVKKGLIKISHAPANRYAYYLTPHGFSEKSRLTAEFLSQSFNLFRHARTAGADIFGECQSRGWIRVALFGASDLAEIFTLSARDFDIELVGVIAELPNASEFAGLPVIAPATCDAAAIEAIVICDISDPQAAYNAAIRILPKSRVLAPRFLGVIDPKSLTDGGPA